MENITKHQIYRNINEQIQYLYDSKKIIVDVEDRHYLEERNYISLVKPYKAFFQQVEITKESLFIKRIEF